jgi:thiol-disulfide isomerase/thioredoxin
LQASAWFKGAPVTRFEPGKVYVLEFWATWCTYCIQAMPHLSELSARYGDQAVFIGVDVMERPPHGVDRQEWIDRTVGEAVARGVGRAMTYRSCTDAGEFMQRTWLPGAAQVNYPVGALPVTFVVDQKGRVAWIGHPFSPAGAFDRALEQIVAGTFDLAGFIASSQAAVAAASARRADQMQDASQRAATIAPLLQPMFAAVTAGDHSRVISEAMNAIAQDPTTVRETFRPRLDAFKALLQSNPAAAIGLLGLERDLAAKKLSAHNVQLTDIMSAVASQAGLPASAYADALAVIEAQNPLGRPFTFRWARALALGFFHSGQITRAIEVQTIIVERLQADASLPVELDTATLQRFRAAAPR